MFFISKLSTVTLFHCFNIDVENVFKCEGDIIRFDVSLAIIKEGLSVISCKRSIQVVSINSCSDFVFCLVLSSHLSFHTE